MRGRFARGRSSRSSSRRRIASSRRVCTTRAIAAAGASCSTSHTTRSSRRRARSSATRSRASAKRDVSTPSIVQPSPSQWRYRRKLTLALRWRRERWIAGLHPFDDPMAVFALDDCPITDDRVVAVWREVLAARRACCRAHSELRGAVRLTDDGASLVLEGGSALADRPRQFADRGPDRRRPSGGSRRRRPRVVARRPAPNRVGAGRWRRSPDAAFVQVDAAAATRSTIM